MFENIGKFFKKIVKAEQKENTSKDTAKERLHLVLMQDRANVSADFLELMKLEIIDVIKKYIVVDEGAIDVRLTNQANDDGTNGAPALYANIPILNIKSDLIEERIEEITEEAEAQENETQEMGVHENEAQPEEEKVEKEIEIEAEVEEVKEPEVEAKNEAEIPEEKQEEIIEQEIKEEKPEEIKEENKNKKSKQEKKSK